MLVVYGTLLNREEKHKKMENPKQQAIERLKASNNVLVTVSNNPSIDQLAAAIGLTLFLNKLGKHATTVFSGQVPSILEFLQPEKSIEKNTDSLRDFIIALDKSKADKLRYKVEDRVVKIFITPYHTSIGEKDLEFSHGDFNVDAVLAIGVQKREELDQAITSHGRILHDATVLTVNTQSRTDIGAINWQDPNVSSLCELAYGIAETLQADAVDGQMATAFLTGIVAETERFSNSKTSSTAMAISSKLMTAGANQQLVATKLQPPKPQPKPVDPTDESFKVPKGSAEDNATKKPVENTIAPTAAPASTPSAPMSATETELPKPVKDDGAMTIDHNDKPAVDINQILNSEELEEDSVEEVHIDDQGTLKYAAEMARDQKAAEASASQISTDSGSPTPPVNQAPTIGAAPNTPVDPLTTSTNPSGQPLLSHNSPLPGPSTPPDLNDLLRANSSSDVEPSADADANAISFPSMPEAPDFTLTDLEKSVGSPHLQSNGANNTDVSHIDRAREAVTSAVSGAPAPLEPTASLNASPIDLNPDFVAPRPDVYSAGLEDSDLPANLVPPRSPVDTTASPNDTTAPPLVPPPLMPPMPMTPMTPPSSFTPPPNDIPAPPTPGNPLFPQP